MRATFPAFLSLACAILCRGQTPSVGYYEAVPRPAHYANGHLFNWSERQITFYRPDTQPPYSIRQQGERAFTLSWAVDSDGEAARVYTEAVRANEVYSLPEGRIDLFDPTGKLALTIKTGSYWPQGVSFAPDHSIWTLGYNREAINAVRDGKENTFDVLHHYARTGEELGQMLPGAQIATEDNSGGLVRSVIGGRRLFAAGDRLGFVADPHTWIEVSFAGVLLGKHDLGSFPELAYYPMAMTLGGRTYASIYKEGEFDGWATLDCSTHSWRKVTGYPKGWLIGSDGDNVVFSKEVGAWTVLQSVPSGSLGLEAVQKQAAAAISDR